MKKSLITCYFNFSRREVSLQANFIDENLEINIEELNEAMEVIHELIKIIPGDHTYYLPNNSTPCYACKDKSNLKKHLLKKNNNNFGKQTVET